MNQRLFRLFSVVIALALIFAGCAPQQGAAPASDKIQIGLQAPLTGDFAAEGQWAKQSVEVAADLINKKGGVLGKQIEIVVADDASNPKDSALAAQKLVSQGLQAVIGSYGSSVTAPAADLYDANKVVSVGYGCTAVRLTMEKQRPYFFRTAGRDDTQSEFFVKFATETLKAKTIAIMHDNQDYGKGVADDAKKFMQPFIDSGQVELVYFDAITPGESDYSAVVSQIKQLNPDVWFFTGYYPEAALLLKQAKEAGVTSQFVGNNAVPTPEFVKIAGNDVVAGSIWAVYAADALNALAAAITKAGSTDPDAVAAAMRSMTDAKGITGALLFTERGDRKDIPYYAYVYNANGELELYK